MLPPSSPSPDEFAGNAGPLASAENESWQAAEMLGLDGPFTFPERLLQKIWLRGDFGQGGGRGSERHGLFTADGRPVRVVDPGRWNLLAGPDFRDAHLVIDGREARGDVELHINAADWRAHGHADDPAYDGVVLHVVLFPPGEAFTRGSGGRLLPVVPLLPVLHQDLEAIAMEEAVETLAGRSLTELRAVLRGASELAVLDNVLLRAGRRWRQKVYFARRRIERLGWEAACHHAALEVLGYRMNRPPMLTVAARFPIERWRGGGMAPERVAEAAWETCRDQWKHRGVRPANHPGLRLRQYAAWMTAVPDWPARLRTALPDLVNASRAAARAMSAAQEAAGGKEGGKASLPVGEARRCSRLRELRRELACLLGAEVLGPGSTRLDSFFCDAVLPLAAVATGNDGAGEADERVLSEWLWQVWLPGDQPEEFADSLQELGLTSRAAPACHGMFQGLLGWMLQHSPAFRTGDK